MMECKSSTILFIVFTSRGVFHSAASGFQLRQFPVTSHYDISDMTTFFHFFVTQNFELFVRKDDNVCNKLDEVFIITNMWYFVFIRVLLFRVNIRPRNNRNVTVSLNWSYQKKGTYFLKSSKPLYRNLLLYYLFTLFRIIF